MDATNLKATMVTVAFVIFLMSCSAASALSIFSSTGQQQHNMDRRTAIATSISMPFLITSVDSVSAVSSDSSSTPQSTPAATENGPIIANPNPRGITSILINSPKQSAGLELYETKIGTPRRTVVAVRSVRAGGEGAKVGAQRGMILLDYTHIEDVLKRISSNNGPSSSYPIEIRLYNLALGGDAVGDLGRGIVSPDDALELAESVSSNGSSGQVMVGSSTQTNQGFMINIIRNARGECGMKSRRGDTMQIRYTARVGDRNGIVYDSSDYRGTGQPYAYILGNNDVIKGVDLGTYDMCPGEIRELTIPPEVGYPNGSKLFKQIPPRSQLFWSVELVELNSVTEENNDRPRAERY